MAERISVVIPTLRARPVLARCLAALEQQRFARDEFEVLVVRDAASDDRAPLPPWVRALRADVPGASAARNEGWRNARAPIVLFLDDDILAGPNLLARHAEWHHREPGDEVGVIGPVVWARDLRVTPFMRWLEAGWQFDYLQIEGTSAEWWHLYTANASLKRTLLERGGGFDTETFPFLYEDLDLARRLHDEHGFRLLFNPDAYVEHLLPVTLEDWRTRVVRLAIAERRFVRRYPDAEPYFHRRFSEAVTRPRARGRGARFASIVPPAFPFLGPRVHASADWYFRQALAPVFLDAWEAAGDPHDPVVAEQRFCGGE